MILDDEKTVEVMTSLKPSRLPSTKWYEFAIYSHNGNTWTKHCDGQAKGGRDDNAVDLQLPGLYTRLPRQVRSPYPIFTRAGLHYGPAFQGLESVCAKPGHRTATASLRLPPETGSAYPLHPTTIDQCLQLLGLASAEGLGHHFEQILLPTMVESLYIHPAPDTEVPMQARARAVLTAGSSGNVQGEMAVVAGEQVLLRAHGCKLFPLEHDQAGLSRDDRIAAARMCWRPDLDFIPLESLMTSHTKDLGALQLMETYVFLCTVEIQHRIRDHAPYDGHFGKFHHWIDQCVDQGRRGENRLVAGSSELMNLQANERVALIRQLQGKIADSEFGNVAELVSRLLDNCVEVFKGETEILDVYLRDGGLTKLYAITGDRIDSTEFFITAGHTNPTMRVLEIGAGTGGTTLVALQALTSINGEPMYARYTQVQLIPTYYTSEF
jgi:hypothetical protein